jgi:hypothetical protein
LIICLLNNAVKRLSKVSAAGILLPQEYQRLSKETTGKLGDKFTAMIYLLPVQRKLFPILLFIASSHPRPKGRDRHSCLP